LAALAAMSQTRTMFDATPSPCSPSSFPQSNVSRYYSSTDFRLSWVFRNCSNRCDTRSSKTEKPFVACW
jgi:hypothetical protein